MAQHAEQLGVHCPRPYNLSSKLVEFSLRLQPSFATRNDPWNVPNTEFTVPQPPNDRYYDEFQQTVENNASAGGPLPQVHWHSNPPAQHGMHSSFTASSNHGASTNASVYQLGTRISNGPSPVAPNATFSWPAEIQPSGQQISTLFPDYLAPWKDQGLNLLGRQAYFDVFERPSAPVAKRLRSNRVLSGNSASLPPLENVSIVAPQRGEIASLQQLLDAGLKNMEQGSYNHSVFASRMSQSPTDSLYATPAFTYDSSSTPSECEFLVGSASPGSYHGDIATSVRKQTTSGLSNSTFDANVPLGVPLITPLRPSAAPHTSSAVTASSVQPSYAALLTGNAQSESYRLCASQGPPASLSHSTTALTRSSSVFSGIPVIPASIDHVPRPQRQAFASQPLHVAHPRSEARVAQSGLSFRTPPNGSDKLDLGLCAGIEWSRRPVPNRSTSMPSIVPDTTSLLNLAMPSVETISQPRDTCQWQRNETKDWKEGFGEVRSKLASPGTSGKIGSQTACDVSEMDGFRYYIPPAVPMPGNDTRPRHAEPSGSVATCDSTGLNCDGVPGACKSNPSRLSEGSSSGKNRKNKVLQTVAGLSVSDIPIEMIHEVLGLRPIYTDQHKFFCPIPACSEELVRSQLSNHFWKHIESSPNGSKSQGRCQVMGCDASYDKGHGLVRHYTCVHLHAESMTCSCKSRAVCVSRFDRGEAERHLRIDRHKAAQKALGLHWVPADTVARSDGNRKGGEDIHRASRKRRRGSESVTANTGGRSQDGTNKCTKRPRR